MLGFKKKTLPTVIFCREYFYELGQPRRLFIQQIGHAPTSFISLDLKFQHGLVHVLMDTLASCPLFLFGGDTTDEKLNTTRNRSKLQWKNRKCEVGTVER